MRRRLDAHGRQRYAHALKSHTLKVALLLNAGPPLLDLKTGKRCSSQGFMMVVELSFHEDLSL